MLRDYHAEMGGWSWNMAARSSTSPATASWSSSTTRCHRPITKLRAVRMACAMRDRFDTMHEAWRKRGYELGFGVGMAVGHATMGRIGFEGRYDYAAIGTVVIMASRLCSEAQPGQILVNQRGYSAVEDIVVGEPVGDLALKGFSRPVTAYNIVALVDGALTAARPHDQRTCTRRVTRGTLRTRPFRPVSGRSDAAQVRCPR